MIRVVCPCCQTKMKKVGPDKYVCENEVCFLENVKFSREEGLNISKDKYNKNF